MTTDVFHLSYLQSLLSFFVHDLLANMAYHKFFNIRNTTGAISEAGTAYRYGAAEFIPGFSVIRVAFKGEMQRF